eukprot:1198127-Amphidinium_carterae.1
MCVQHRSSAMTTSPKRQCESQQFKPASFKPQTIVDSSFANPERNDLAVAQMLSCLDRKLQWLQAAARTTVDQP